MDRRISDSLQGIMHLVLDSWLSLNLDLGLHLQQGAHSALLLADERHGLELFLPLIGDSDCILSCCFIRDGISLSISIIDSLLHLFRIFGIPDIVEVRSVALAALGELIWEVILHERLLADIVVQSLD